MIFFPNLDAHLALYSNWSVEFCLKNTKLNLHEQKLIYSTHMHVYKHDKCNLPWRK